LQAGPPILFRHGIVLAMDGDKRVLREADVLIPYERIAAVRHSVDVPEGTVEIDASRGIVLASMVDTHQHMWRTAMRGYGADWTLTQYFVFYYLTHGKVFRPEDIYAGNLLSDAAVDALEAIPGRFVLAYGNIQAGPWEWSTAPEFTDFVSGRFSTGNDMLGFQMAFDVTGDPSSQSGRRSRSPVSSACLSPRTRASGAQPVTRASS
jgi:5-methylthioadenosine/S-adenosylhomocysteine deaminase